METKVVLLPIKVPKVIYCFSKNLNIKCQYFSPLVGCYNGFKPIMIKEDVYKKDKECKNLITESLKTLDTKFYF